jgi:hypothetical protein
MTLSYLVYGISKSILSISIGIFIGILLYLFSTEYELSFYSAIIITDLLLIYYGYQFVKIPVKNNYQQSLLLSIIVSFIISVSGCFFKNFDFLFFIKSFFNILIFFVLGILIHYLKYTFKKKFKI